MFRKRARTSDDSRTDALIHSDSRQRTLKHERTPNVWGQWLAVPKEERNLHQRVAYWTGGLVTAANVATAIGFEAVRRGGIEYERGNHAKGVLLMMLGRPFDLLDGHLAHKYGVTSIPGAIEDSFADKVGTGIMLKGALKEGAIGPVYGTTVAVGQLAMAGYNVGIGLKGGDPNPSPIGKLNMAFTGVALGGAMVEHTLEPYHEEAAAYVHALGIVAKAASIITTIMTVRGYKDQYKAAVLEKRAEAAVI